MPPAFLIKKRKYWPKNIPGQAIIDHMADKAVGSSGALQGVLGGVPFSVIFMKEPDYVMKIMSSFGTLEPNNPARMTSRIADGNTIRFPYPEMVDNHFVYRHLVDDHNNRRHKPISIEETWGTMSWPQRVFAYLLATTEVNLQRFLCFFRSEEWEQLALRRTLAFELINNPFTDNPFDPTDPTVPRTSSVTRMSIRRYSNHVLQDYPAYTTRYAGSGKWKKGKTKYPQRQCVMCTKRIRTYCRCNPLDPLCRECFCRHVEAELEEFKDAT